MFRCRVNLLDDTHIERDLEKNAVGQVLFDEVCDHLNLLERGYFGLAAFDASKNRVWLDFSREVHKQIIGHDATFTFSVKFYPPDPSLLVEDLTRYLLCLQVRLDIMAGRLPCPSDMLAVLGSYVVQSELGDYDPARNGPGYLSTIPLAPNQTPELEEGVAALHQTYNTMTAAQADENFLQNAMTLPLYGVDLHPAKDVSGAGVMLGVSAEEIVVYEGKTKTQSFPWPTVLKISYIRNKFHFRVRHMQDGSESTHNFIVPSYRASKRLWKVAVEHHAFFRNHRPDKYEGLLQLGSRFRFRRNTHTETLEASSNIKRPAPPVAHTAIKKKAKVSMLQALKSPTRIQLDDWFQVFRFDRTRPTSVPVTTYTYQENVASTKVHKTHRYKDVRTGAETIEEEDEDEIPEEEQEWFQLLGTRSFPKQVSLTESEQLEKASPKFWKHNSEDWMVLLYPKISETSLWEKETAPVFRQTGEKELYEEEEWEERSSEGTKIVKIRKGVQIVGEGREELQKVMKEMLEDEGDEQILRRIQEAEIQEGQSGVVFVERRIRRVEIVEKVEREEKIRGVERRLLEVETIGQRLQDVEELKARLQEVEMLEQKLQEQQKQLRDEYDVWFLLLDRRPLAGDLEMAKRRESMRPLEEEPLQKVSPILVRDVWHILLDLPPRSDWATHLPRIPSVEELVKAPVTAEERQQEEVRLQEERRRASQMRITSQYSFPAGRETQPDSDEREDWFMLLDASPKDSMLGKVLEDYEQVREEKVKLVEEQMSFVTMEMPFEVVQRDPDDLQESDSWFLLLDPTPFRNRGVPLDMVEVRRQVEEAWRVKVEERKIQQEQKRLLEISVTTREVEDVLPEHLAEELETSGVRFVEVKTFKEVTRIQKEERKKPEVEEKRARMAAQRERERDEGEDWFVLLQTPTVIKVAKKVDEEQLMKLEEWKTRVKDRGKGAAVREETALYRDVKDAWFILLDASLKDLEVQPPAPSPVISPVVVYKTRPEPKPRVEPKPQPEPRPRLEPTPRPEYTPRPQQTPRPHPTPHPMPTPRPVFLADQPMTSTPTAQPVPVPRPTYLDQTLHRLDITQETEEESESLLIRKRAMKRMEGDSIYVRHSLLMLEDFDVTQEVVMKHHASISELKRIFMEDVPVSRPTEWEKRLSTHSPVRIPQITNGQLTMDTVEMKTIIIRKVEEDEISAV